VYFPELVKLDLAPFGCAVYVRPLYFLLSFFTVNVFVDLRWSYRIHPKYTFLHLCSVFALKNHGSDPMGQQVWICIDSRSLRSRITGIELREILHMRAHPMANY